ATAWAFSASVSWRFSTCCWAFSTASLTVVSVPGITASPGTSMVVAGGSTGAGEGAGAGVGSGAGAGSTGAGSTGAAGVVVSAGGGGASPQAVRVSVVARMAAMVKGFTALFLRDLGALTELLPALRGKDIGVWAASGRRFVETDFQRKRAPGGALSV